MENWFLNQSLKRLSVKILKKINNFGFLTVLNSFERSFYCSFNIMSVHIMSVQIIRSDKVGKSVGLVKDINICPPVSQST